MIRGTIIKVKKGYVGCIHGDDKQKYRFNRKGIVEGDLQQVQVDRRVEFEPDGEWASQIHLLDEVQKIETSAAVGKQAVEKKPESQYSTSSGYRFLNPYNFVRYLEQLRPQGHVLGDCPPPPHDRYVGLTLSLIHI